MSARVLAFALGMLASATAFAVGAPSAANEDIRDIRGPVSIPLWWRWLAIAGGVALLATIAGVVIAAIKRRRARPLEPYELALRRLDEAQSLADQGLARAYALTASNAVREYIEARFSLPATHATTEELFADLMRDDAGRLGEHRQPLTEFISACDLAKFAKVELPPLSLSSMNELARRFVLGTLPAKEPTSARTS